MNLALLQLCSPALPIGGFSYSSGLESALESGEVHDAESARQWIVDAILLGLARFEAPLLVAAWGQLTPTGIHDPEALILLNQRAIASRETAEMRAESLQMGHSLGRWLQAVCPEPAQDDWIAQHLQPLALPVAWAIAARRLGLGADESALAWLWSFAENQVSVLMKAMPMGQMAAQRLLKSLWPVLQRARDQALTTEPGRWSSALPMLAVASSRHETQYSRLFRS
ncbi:MAG: urease accessory protein UreF [Burkholderiales bacterium]